MDYKQLATEALEFAKKKKHKGQVNPISLIIMLATGLMVGVVVLYVLVQLGTALNNNNTTAVVNNVQTMFINFTAQLGTVGTLMGIGLFLLVIFGGYMLGRGLLGGKGGSGM